MTEILRKYPALTDALYLHSVDLGLEDPDETLCANAESEVWRTRLLHELLSALSDPATDWISLLSNPKYAVDGAESQRDGREIVLGLLWHCASDDPPPLPCD